MTKNLLINLAWRNIWRNKRRSAVVLSSIIVGVAAIISMDGLTNGMTYQMLFNQINLGTSHIQIHKTGYTDNRLVKNFIQGELQLKADILRLPGVKAVSERVVTFGLVSSAESSAGIYVYGVDHKAEKRVSAVSGLIKEGNYLSGAEREVVVGYELANKLNAGLGNKIILMANDPSGKIHSDVFRISGLFESFSSGFDKSYIFVNSNDLQNMLSLGNSYHELAIIVAEPSLAESLKGEIRSAVGSDFEVKTYRDILPILVMQIDLSRESMWIVNMIIGIALVFGIINVMLMTVIERIREFGVLMAIGLSTGKLFSLILLEALIIGLSGTIIGLVITGLIHIPFSYTGIDFSWFSEGLVSLGVGAVIYPVISYQTVLLTIIMTPMIAVAGAIYPAIKAIRLQPVAAIRHY